MEQEDDFGNMGSGPSGAVKTIIFIMVAVLIITTVAIPILASVGEVTTTHKNDGVRVSDVFEKYADFMAEGVEYHGELLLKPTEVRLCNDANDPDSGRMTILNTSDIDQNYPVIFIWNYWTTASVYSMDYYTFDENGWTRYDAGSSYSVTQLGTNVGESIFTAERGHMFIQDPNGKYILTNGTVEYDATAENPDLVGMTISQTAQLWCIGTSAYLKSWASTNYGPAQVGTADLVASENDGIMTVSKMSFNGTDTTYLIGPLGYTTTENIIDGSIIGTLLGIIPLLMIVGVVIYVVGRMNVSDR